MTTFTEKSISVLKTVAPALASVFGTSLAGSATKTILDIILPQEKDITPEKVEQKLLSLSAEDSLKLLQANQRFEIAKQRLEIETLKAYLGDVANARDRDVKKGTNLRADILSYGIMTCFVGFMLLVFFKGVPDSGGARDIIFSLGSALATFLTTIIGFEFGTSRSSADKNFALNKMVESISKP